MVNKLIAYVATSINEDPSVIDPFVSLVHPTAITGADSTRIGVEKDYTRSSFFGLAVTNWHDYAIRFTWPVKEFDALSRGKRGIDIGSVSSLTRMRPHQRFLSLSRTRAFPGFLALSVEKKKKNGELSSSHCPRAR